MWHLSSRRPLATVIGAAPAEFLQKSSRKAIRGLDLNKREPQALNLSYGALREALAKHEKFLEEMAKKDGVPEKEFPEASGKCNAEDWPPQKRWGGEALDKQKEMGRGVGTGGDEVQTGCRNFEMEEESRRPPILLAQVQRSPQTRQVEDQMSQISAGDGQKQLKEQNWPSSWLQWKQLRTALGQMHKRKDLVKKVQASQKAGRPAGLKGLKSKKQMTVKAVKD
ncbi:unnamed protein product [Cladocopium goreaui]|uniref:Uncharacterized protein n=1 Tax=Cladocopium goreaui TaxID=2562237 RepID=A0A9P1CVG1_9DINO|nr:unnamed protein product [Cladocopium goreaui]